MKIGSGAGMVALTFSTDGGARTLKYDRVLCALPFTMLRLVEGIDELPISIEKKRSIANLGYGSNVELMLGFTERWCATRWPDCRRSVTAASSPTSHCNAPETSRGQYRSSGVLTNFMGGLSRESTSPLLASMRYRRNSIGSSRALKTNSMETVQ